jgi:hypothetical protein
MWESPRGAAISDDEAWCVVIGLGFVAFPLRPGREMRSHWRHPFHERWQLRLPMTGDLAGAVMFTGVRALSGHQFGLSTLWGLGNAWTTREWVYDADTDTIGEPHDIIDEAKRRQSVRPEVSAQYAQERQLAATFRDDHAESTALAGTTFELGPQGGERVLARGKPVGEVLCRSSRFVVWQELGSMVCAEGEELPWLLLDDMYGGARAAAISATRNGASSSVAAFASGTFASQGRTGLTVPIRATSSGSTRLKHLVNIRSGFAAARALWCTNMSTTLTATGSWQAGRLM